jgi:hypothetical protein
MITGLADNGDVQQTVRMLVRQKAKSGFIWKLLFLVLQIFIGLNQMESGPALKQIALYLSFTMEQAPGQMLIHFMAIASSLGVSHDR